MLKSLKQKKIKNKTKTANMMNKYNIFHKTFIHAFGIRLLLIILLHIYKIAFAT